MHINILSKARFSMPASLKRSRPFIWKESPMLASCCLHVSSSLSNPILPHSGLALHTPLLAIHQVIQSSRHLALHLCNLGDTRKHASSLSEEIKLENHRLGRHVGKSSCCSGVGMSCVDFMKTCLAFHMG